MTDVTQQFTRLNELVKQARVEVVRPGIYTEGEFLFKFAELIIQECVSVCMDLEKLPASSPKHYAQDIRIHFGFDDSPKMICPECGDDRFTVACPKGETATLTKQCPMVGESQ